MAKTLPALPAQETETADIAGMQADAHVADMENATADIAADIEAEDDAAPGADASDLVDTSGMTDEAREAAEAEASNRFMMRQRATLADVENIKSKRMSIAAQIKALRVQAEQEAEREKQARKEAGITRGSGVTAITKQILLRSPWLNGDDLCASVNVQLRRNDPDNKLTKRSTTDTIRTDLIHTLRQLEKAGMLNEDGDDALSQLVKNSRM